MLWTSFDYISQSFRQVIRTILRHEAIILINFSLPQTCKLVSSSSRRYMLIFSICTVDICRLISVIRVSSLTSLLLLSPVPCESTNNTAICNNQRKQVELWSQIVESVGRRGCWTVVNEAQSRWAETQLKKSVPHFCLYCLWYSYWWSLPSQPSEVSLNIDWPKVSCKSINILSNCRSN